MSKHLDIFGRATFVALLAASISYGLRLPIIWPGVLCAFLGSFISSYLIRGSK